METKHKTPETITLGHIRKLLPEAYSQMFKDYPDEQVYIEAEPVLEEIWKMYQKDYTKYLKGYRGLESEIRRFNTWAGMVLIAWTQMSYKDFEKLPEFQKFWEEYPASGKVILIWGWS